MEIDEKKIVSDRHSSTPFNLTYKLEEFLKNKMTEIPPQYENQEFVNTNQYSLLPYRLEPQQKIDLLIIDGPFKRQIWKCDSSVNHMDIPICPEVNIYSKWCRQQEIAETKIVTYRIYTEANSLFNWKIGTSLNRSFHDCQILVRRLFRKWFAIIIEDLEKENGTTRNQTH